jgi:hypothetical protein
MASAVSDSPMIHSVRRLSALGVFPVFLTGDGVQFLVAGGLVRARVLGIDARARKVLPHGSPYRLRVVDAPPQSGYAAGTDCTIRSACLELDPTAAGYEQSLATASTVVMAPYGGPPLTHGLPTFLVAFQREGGNAALQGALLVQDASLEAASAAAMESLTAELEVDVRDRGEHPDAAVKLLSASAVPTITPGRAVVASVTW